MVSLCVAQVACWPKDAHTSNTTVLTWFGNVIAFLVFLENLLAKHAYGPDMNLLHIVDICRYIFWGLYFQLRLYSFRLSDKNKVGFLFLWYRISRGIEFHVV